MNSRVHPEHTNQDLSETSSSHLLGIIHGHDDAAVNEGEIANIHNLLTVSQASISQCVLYSLNPANSARRYPLLLSPFLIQETKGTKN